VVVFFHKILNRAIDARPILYIVLLLIIVFSLWHYPMSINITNNGGAYLLQSLKIYNGVNLFEIYNGINPEMHGRPVYPLILSVCFFLFGGPSLLVAQWATLLIYATSIILVYYLTKMLYGQWIALLSA